MHKFLNTNSLGRATTPDAVIAEVLSLGITGLELSLAGGLPLEAIKSGAAQAQLPIASVFHPDFDLFSLIDPDESARAQALELGRELIRAAGSLGRDCLVTLPAHTRQPAGYKLDHYEDALFAAFAQMERLVLEAEAVSARIAMENPASGLFLSPLELRTFIDQLNTPYAGVAFNPAQAEPLGSPADWLHILGARVFSLRLPLLPQGLLVPDWLCREIETLNFTGPIIFS